MITSWYSMHPMLILFPIALLLVVPLFILVGAVLPPLRGRPYTIAAFLLLSLGTAGLFIAVPGGEAARAVCHCSAAGSVLRLHESLARETKIVFAGLLAIDLGMILIAPLPRRPENRLFSTALPLAFLILYSAGAILLVNTAW